MMAIPPKPMVTALTSGVMRAYYLTSSQIDDLATIMWGDDFISGLNKFMGDATPYQAIQSISILPYINYASISGDSETIKIGNFTLLGATGMRINDQIMDVPMGSYTFTEYFGNALDYEPYTSIKINLPFLGQIEILPSEVMNCSITIIYRVDIATGSFIAYIYNNTKDTYYRTEAGNMQMTIPLSSSNNSQFCSDLRTIASAAATGFTAGLSGSKTKPKLKKGSSSPLDLGQIIDIGKPQTTMVSSNSSLLGAYGYLGSSNVWGVICRPDDSTAAYYNSTIGYAANSRNELSSLSGYTRVSEINLEVKGASSEEIDEIESLLKGGVIL